MADELDIPRRIHLELALLAVQSALAEVRLLEELEMTTAELRQSMPGIITDLNISTYYLKILMKAETETSGPVAKQ